MDELLEYLRGAAENVNLPQYMRDRLTEAAAALEAAREDGERLDWLDANGSAVRRKGNSRRNLIIWGAVHVPSYRTIRHAIDQARGKGGCEEGVKS